MNALKSYSSDDDSDNSCRPTKSVKEGDPGTNYDSVGMDISEDSDDEKHNVTKGDCNQNLNSRNKEASLHTRDNIENTLSRDSRDRRESSSGSSRDSRERSSQEARHRQERDRRRDSDRHHDDRGRRDYNSNRGDHQRYGRDRSHSRERQSRRSSGEQRRRSRSRSRSQERRRPNDIRREAQQKLAAMKASNPNFDQSDLLRQSMVEQIAELEKQTGVILPTYYNPATMNPAKLAEQERKKKLLWGNKKKTPAEEPIVAACPSSSSMPEMQGAIWANTRFNNDNDGKMAEKFKRLMGVKIGGGNEEARVGSDALRKQESLFVTMEKQYETARMTTHTNKGCGLGFPNHPFIPKQ